MSDRSVRVDVVRSVMRLMGEQFRTKELSNHPEMRRAHAGLVTQRNYHAWVGGCLSAYVDEAEQIGPSNGSTGVLWRNTLATHKTSGTPAPTITRTSTSAQHASRPVRPGHYAAVKYLGSEKFARVKELFEAEPEIGGVYFRPGDGKLTVVDLHPDSLKPRVGVGTSPYLFTGTTALSVAPTMPGRVAHLRAVRARQKAPSLENQLEARLIRSAQANGLRLPGFPDHLRFIHSQWRIDRPDGSGQQFTDLMAVDLIRRELVLIELKRERDLGAHTQVRQYVEWFRQHGTELSAFFLALARVMGKLYGCPELASLDALGTHPLGIAAWPKGDSLEVVGLEVVDTAPASSVLGPQSASDDAFRARMRLHQSWYRAEVLKAECGTGPEASSTKHYGNMLTRADGERGLNFLSPTIYEIALRRLADSKGVVERFRLLHNMLSSQPLCFNLFGELAADHALAQRLLDGLAGLDVAEVLEVKIEYAPEPASEYLDDCTAFDAFVDYRRRDGAQAFLGVETKLTEPFSEQHYDRPTYRRWMDSPRSPFRTDAHDKVDDVRHNQLWRDHLLAVALRDHASSPYQHATLMLVRHPQDQACARVVDGYRRLLTTRDDSFIDMPLDRLVSAWRAALGDGSREEWLDALDKRYLKLAASEGAR